MNHYDLEQELKQNLSPNEKLLWTGKPKNGFMLRSSDAFFIPFSLFWFGFILFWEKTVLTTGAPFPMALFGIPFILVGLYITIGRFFVDEKKRSNTVYGITPERIIIKEGIFSKEIKSLNIKTLSDITIAEKDNNNGTITLGPTDPRYSMMQGIEWPGIKQAPRLEAIEEVRDVYNKIIALQRNHNNINNSH